MKIKKPTFCACTFLFVLVLILSIAPGCPVVDVPDTLPGLQPEGVKKFTSEADFKEYLDKGLGARDLGFGQRSLLEAPGQALTMEDAAAPSRVSETNVQVAGIDEPDIVKTNGKEIYFSPEPSFGILPGAERGTPSMILPDDPVDGDVFREEAESSSSEAPGSGSGGVTAEEPVMRSIAPPPTPALGTKVVKAFPANEISELAKIDKQGELFLHEDTLVVLSGRELLGYDIGNPEKPELKWTNTLESGSSLEASRLFDGKIYAVTKSSIDKGNPCPVKPMVAAEDDVSIACKDIYHPAEAVAVDVTYTAMVLDPGTGSVEQQVAFVGSAMTSTVYVSQTSIYVTYLFSDSVLKFFTGFLTENEELFPAELSEKVERLEGYEISENSKLFELNMIFQTYFNSLDEKQMAEMAEQFEKRGGEYYTEHKRDFEKTGIVKIELEKLRVTANGDVPGSLLNQFSLDEHEDHLRVATTIGDGGGFGLGLSFGFGVSETSANDVYVLDEDLKRVGEVLDLGKGERIFSARFIGDEGYMVTFRQIDPFFVLDLSDPKQPRVKGELKIPGFSSYLHPVSDDEVLGTGQEGAQVKISFFDVSSPDTPREKDKYLLDEGWSDVLSNFHAFMLDSKHEIFFIPGSGAGYVFSYGNDKLELKKKVDGVRARRALYIDDFLYVIGDDMIVVLDETNWETINELVLQ